MNKNADQYQNIFQMKEISRIKMSVLRGGQEYIWSVVKVRHFKYKFT